MNFKTIFFLVFLFISNLIFSQKSTLKMRELSKEEILYLNYIEGEKAKYRAKYCVKKISHFKTKADNKGNLTSKKKITSRKEFNKNGKPISKEYFYYNVTRILNDKNKKNRYITKKKTRNKTTFDYNNKGSLLKTNYSEDGKLIRSIKGNKNNHTTYKTKLELDSLKITYFSRLSDIKLYQNYKHKYKFDKQNRIVKWTATNKIQKSTKRKFYYSYSQQGYIKKNVSFYSNFGKGDYSVSEYNLKGFETKSYKYSINGILKEINEFKYEYFE